MKVRITQTFDGAGIVKSREAELTPEVVPDGPPVCLTFKNSILASDKLEVKTFTDGTPEDPKSTGLLASVTSSTTDFTGLILRRIAAAILTIRSGDPEISGLTPFELNQASETTRTTQRFSVDPLDPYDMARNNVDIRPANLCLVVPNLTFDSSVMTPAEYCANPFSALQRAPSRAPELRLSTRNFPTAQPGILYRPRLDYRMHVYEWDTPDQPRKWVLRTSTGFSAENLSPVFSIGISRSAFAARHTVMIFDQGALIKLCSSKGSEAAGFVSIPIEIARGIVRVPASIVKIDLRDDTRQAELINAQAELLKLQTAVLNGTNTQFNPSGFQDPSPNISLSKIGADQVPTATTIGGPMSLNKLCNT